MILIPIKNLATAKQRLASVLDKPRRTELAQAMLLDVLHAVANCADKQVAMVTTDPYAASLAQEFNFETISDNNVSETAAIELATQVCESRGIESTLVIPGDIPLITAQELDQILQAAPVEGSVLAPLPMAEAQMPSTAAPPDYSRCASAMTASNPISQRPVQQENHALRCRCRVSLWTWTTLPIFANLQKLPATRTRNVWSVNGIVPLCLSRQTNNGSAEN